MWSAWRDDDLVGIGALAQLDAARGELKSMRVDDRFRGIYGSRDVLLIHTADMDRLGFAAEEVVEVCTAVDDGVDLRGASAARAADRLKLGPPFAPDAERCALAVVLSSS